MIAWTYVFQWPADHASIDAATPSLVLPLVRTAGGIRVTCRCGWSTHRRRWSVRGVIRTAGRHVSASHHQEVTAS